MLSNQAPAMFVRTAGPPFSWLTAAGFAALLAVSGGCGRSASDAPAPLDVHDDAEQVLHKVTIIKPITKTILRQVAQPGVIEAFERTPIVARIPGYVKNWNVDIGDLVKENDVLAELSVPEMFSELKLKEELVQQAQQALALTRAQLVTARSQVLEAEAAHSRAQFNHDYWKVQNDRFTSLVKDSVLAKQNQEETLNQFRSAASALSEAKAKVASAQAVEKEKEIAQQKAEVDILAAEAARRTQADLVGYARLTAPYAGVVVQKNVNTKQFVQPATGVRGDALYVVEKVDTVRIFVAVPETDADWVSVGMTATVKVRGLAGQEFKRVVTRTASSLNPVNRTLLTEIDAKNPLQDPKLPMLGRWLRPGMYVYVTIDGEWPGVLTIPASAVVTEGDVNVGYKTFCYIVEEANAGSVRRRVKRTEIEIGARNSQLVEVLRKKASAAQNGGESRWQDFSGNEEIAERATGLADAQSVEANLSEK